MSAAVERALDALARLGTTTSVEDVPGGYVASARRVLEALERSTRRERAAAELLANLELDAEGERERASSPSPWG